LLSGRKRVCIFSAKDVAKNVRERSNAGKEKQKGLIAKLMPKICVKGSCFKTPLYDHVPGNKRDGDKDRV
jgi:hypothetical protein